MPADTELQAPALKPSASPAVSDESIFVWIVVFWICSLLYFDPRILALLITAPNLLSRIAILIFVGCLDLFWLFTIYYVVMIGVSWWLRRKEPEIVLPPLCDHPSVAILYPTRNDFREDAVENLLQLDYPKFHLFILDDSDLEEYRQRINGWVSRRSDKVTVIRRPDRRGFKAGNVNHALKQIHSDYSYFAVCDSDGVFPTNFIKDLLPHFEIDPTIAFVQARQDGNPDQPGFFGQAMGYAVAMHFRHYVRARQNYGFVMFYGHGALMKTSIWEEAGGFPEIVTEDLAYSAKIREMGYRGVYTERVICYEDYPPTYAQLRKRTEKWIRGTAEFLKLYYAEFWRSPKVPWFEKVDVLVHATTHFMAIPMLVFLLTLGTILPAYFSHFRYPGSFFLMPVPENKNAFDYLIHVRYHIFWSVDFYVLMVLTIFSPMLPVIFDLRKQPRKLFQYLAVSNFVYLACLVAEAASVLAFLVTGKAFFRNTHDAAQEKKISLKDFFREYHPNHPVVFAAELVMGAILFWIGWRTKNLWFMAPAIALLLSPPMRVIGWTNSWMRKLTYIPFAIGIFIVSIVTVNLTLTLLTKILR